jgi:hypothetical protein
MATTNLKKYLKSFTKEELINHIVELDKKFKPVQEYYQLCINKDVEEVLNKYRKQIENEFYPARGEPKMRLAAARKAVNEAQKLGIPAESMADLMLFYVETGVEFTNDYGDINEAFYNSMESMYLKALKFMGKKGLLKQFENRSLQIVNKTVDIGWGFHDTLGDYFYQFY